MNVIYCIGENISFLIHIGNYGCISTTYPTTTGYYVVNFLSNYVILKEYSTIYRQVFKSCELAVTSVYIRSIKTITNWYYKPENNQQILNVSTCTVVRPCLDVAVVSDVVYTAISVYNRNQ